MSDFLSDCDTWYASWPKNDSWTDSNISIITLNGDFNARTYLLRKVYSEIDNCNMNNLVLVWEVGEPSNGFNIFTST